MNSETRVGQWKLTEQGAIKCIAEGGGFVMARGKSRWPVIVDSRIWDECFDYYVSEDFDFPDPPTQPGYIQKPSPTPEPANQSSP